MEKVVIVSGSDGGIGASIVNTYLEDNYLVIGLDRNYSDITREEQFIKVETDLISFVKDDNYQNDIILRLKNLIPNSINKLVIINNAAEQIVKPIQDITFSDFDRSILVNALAPFFLIKNFIKELNSYKGHIINITSIHSKLTKPNFTCYASSKALLEGINRSLSLELSSMGISVNSVAPAAIQTEMLRSGFKKKEQLRELENYHPSKTIGTPQEVALFIKSITDQDCRFLTGTVLEFNGGIGIRLHDPS